MTDQSGATDKNYFNSNTILGLMSVVIVVLLVAVFQLATNTDVEHDNVSENPGSRMSDTNRQVSTTNSQNSKVKAVSSPDNPVISINTTLGNMRIELFPDASPATVAKFLELIQGGYYSTETVLESKPGIGFVVAKIGSNAQQFKVEQDDANNLASQRGSVAVLRSKISPAYLNNIFVGYYGQEQLQDNYVIIGQLISGIDAIEKNSEGRRGVIQSVSTQANKS